MLTSNEKEDTLKTLWTWLSVQEAPNTILRFIYLFSEYFYSINLERYSPEVTAMSKIENFCL